MPFADKPTARTENLVVQEVNDEVLIYDLVTNKAYCLNHTSGQVWQLCDGNNSIADIGGRISDKLQTPFSEDIVWLALDGLKRNGLVMDTDDLPPDPNRLSRRAVMKKIGFASMVAMPIISSLVAPPAVAAISGGQACSCSGLSGAVAVCPVGTASCPPASARCVILPGGFCFGPAGDVSCNGTCQP